MGKFKEEIEKYWQRKVYVYPFTNVLDNLKWSEWRNVKDTEYINRMYTYYETEAIGLKLVAGKKGVCGIGIRRDTNDRHSRGIVRTALSLLNLPEDYLWVIHTPHEYIIIVDLQEGLSSTDQKLFENVRIIWEEDIQLPNRYEKDSYPVQFMNLFFPSKHPTQISKSTLYKGITKLAKKDIILPGKSWWKRLFNL